MMNTEANSFLTARPFEAGFLGGPVFDCADPHRADEAVEVARRSGAVLISCRTDRDGLPLEKAGFRKVETLVTFERETEGAEVVDSNLISIRDGSGKDIDACRRIAKEALRWDRFHVDHRIPDDAADALKAAWIENDLQGRAALSLVATFHGTVSGFCAVLLRPGLSVIDLIAVAPDYHGKGIGRALVSSALSQVRDKVPVMRVGTQAANPSSLKFYRKLGFVEISRADTWHWMPN